jgi:hypothetical protein
MDWDDAARALKRDVREHGGFLTLQKDMLRERFDIGRLAEKISQDLVDTLEEHGLIVFPHPFEAHGTLRIYDVETDIGKIALAVIDPHDVTERALVDAVSLQERADAGKRRRSVCVPWLSALDILLELVIGRWPEGWEELDDDREIYQLVASLATSLGLTTDLGDSETRQMAVAVSACRPRVRWDGAPPTIAAILKEAARKQKYIFDGMLRDAAKHLLGGAEIPSRDVDLGCLGLRHSREV